MSDAKADGAANRCDAGGWVVGAAYEVPTAPEVFQFDERVAMVGCNHLVCAACGAVVRSRAGVSLASAKFDRSGIVERGEWDEALANKLVTEEDGWRTYLCRCRGWSEDDRRALGRPGDWDEYLNEAAPPWRCAGHPVPALPFAIGDATWGDEASAGDVTRRFLSGAVALPAFLTRSPGAALVYAYALVQGRGLDLVIARTCAAALDDADADVRARAADFFRLQPGAPGAERAVSVLADPTLANDDRLQTVVGMRLLLGFAGPDEAAAATRLAGVVPNDYLARGLAQADRAGFIARLDALLVATPTTAMVMRLVAALARKSGPDLVEPIAALADRGLVAREVFTKAAMLVDAPWRQALLDRLG